MNRAVTLSRARETDPLAVNSTTLHQYYNTVQSDASSDHQMVDAAMSRRQAVALQAYRRKSRPRWKMAVAFVLVLTCAFWLFT
jgi:hypothetical protein